MSAKMKIVVRAFSVVMVVALLAGACVYALPSLLGPRAGENTKVVIDGETYRYASLSAPAPQASPSASPSAAPAENDLPRVGSMMKLLALLKANGALYVPQTDVNELEREKLFSGTAATGGSTPMPQASAAPAAEAPAASAMDSGARSGGGDYSSTNTQVSGVDEGDVVKTDGKYIYTASRDKNNIAIVEANGKDMRKMSTIELASQNTDKEYNSFVEMYVQGDYLVAVTSRSIYSEQSNPAMPYDIAPAARMVWNPGKQLTRYTVYDITDRADPVEKRVIELEGSPLTTRMIGNTLYFVQNKYLYSIPFTTALQSSDVLPAYSDSAASGSTQMVPPADIRYFPGSTDTSYMLTGAFDITSNEPFKPEVYMGAGSTVYMSEKSLYVVRSDWQKETDVYRFVVNDASINYSATGKISGYPINQYAMDEYNGHFRVATTSWEDSGSVNRVAVLNTDMKQVGVTPDLAPGEQIYSVRFMGDMGYVVTFRQVDPLFAIDLSDPAKPTVLGELKIPGFSQYLHPLGDGLLVGFGRHTQETFVKNDDGTEEIVGTRDAGLKVSLFDVSDPTNPRELDNIKLGQGSFSEAFDNPRAMMVDSGKNQFGFPIQVSNWDSRNPRVDNWEGYMVVRVENNKLVKAADLKLDANDKYYGWQRRLCYIENTLYGVDDLSITAYDYTTFAKLNRLEK